MKSSDRHLCYGWWSLLVWLTLGLLLEVLHGLKAGWYLDVGNETRRLMFTLGHAHGTLLALINLAAGLTIRNVPDCEVSRVASNALLAAGLLLPLGFLLGGIWIYGGDPGLGIWLVPFGGALLFVGVAGVARSVHRAILHER